MIDTKGKNYSIRLTLKMGVTALWIIQVQAVKERLGLVDDVSPICNEFRHRNTSSRIAVGHKSRCRIL